MKYFRAKKFLWKAVARMKKEINNNNNHHLRETVNDSEKDSGRRKVIRLSEVMVIECDYLKERLFSRKDGVVNERSLRELVDSLQKHASDIGNIMQNASRDSQAKL